MKRGQQDRVSEPPLSRWNRLNLKFFGPPHIGHYEGPWEKADPDPECPFCSQRESAHIRDSSADGKRLRRCPTA